jgi:hypothetical protein
MPTTIEPPRGTGPSGFLTDAEVAAYYQYSLRQMYKLRKLGQIPAAFKVGLRNLTDPGAVVEDLRGKAEKAAKLTRDRQRVAPAAE